MRLSARGRDRHPTRDHGDSSRGAYAGSGAELPHTEAAARDVVLLPLFPGLSDEAQDYVVDRLAQLRRRGAGMTIESL